MLIRHIHADEKNTASLRIQALRINKETQYTGGKRGCLKSLEL
jgi:hypothetical protein